MANSFDKKHISDIRRTMPGNKYKQDYFYLIENIATNEWYVMAWETIDPRWAYEAMANIAWAQYRDAVNVRIKRISKAEYLSLVEIKNKRAKQ